MNPVFPTSNCEEANNIPSSRAAWYVFADDDNTNNTANTSFSDTTTATGFLDNYDADNDDEGYGSALAYGSNSVNTPATSVASVDEDNGDDISNRFSGFSSSLSADDLHGGGGLDALQRSVMAFLATLTSSPVEEEIESGDGRDGVTGDGVVDMNRSDVRDGIGMVNHDRDSEDEGGIE